MTALILNPRSARIREGTPLRDRARRLGLPVAEPGTVEELDRVLAEFVHRGVRTLAVAGGDGTVRDVLTALTERFGRLPLRLAVLPSGKINLVARDVGFDGPNPLERLADGAGLAVSRRPVLRLDRPPLPPAHGMFLGAGAFTEAWKLANTHLHPKGMENIAAVPVAGIATLVQALTGSGERDILAGEPMRFSLPGRPSEYGPRFLVLATTLRRLVYGVWPFRPDGKGGISWLEVEAPPRRLAVALSAILLNRQEPWLDEAGYHSGRAEQVEMTLPGPVVLDGEPFEPGAGGRIRLSAAQQAEFVHP